MIRNSFLTLGILISMAMAKAPGQPGTVLYFKTTNCYWCDKFEAETKPHVKKVFPYWAANNEAACQSYGIKGYPAFVVFDPDGNWRVHEGFMTIKQFNAFVREK